MPYICCVPNCRGNYDAENKVHIFSFPKDQDLKRKWISQIPRKDYVITNSSRVCQRHFKKEDILWETIFVNETTGETLKARLKYPKLREGAIPSIFPGCAFYLSSGNVSRRTIKGSLSSKKKYDAKHNFSSLRELEKLVEEKQFSLYSTKDKPELELPQPHQGQPSTDQSMQALELNPSSSKVPQSSYKVVPKDSTFLSSIPNVPIKLFKAASSNFILPDVSTTETSSSTPTDNVSKLSAVNKYETVLSSMSCERFPKDQTHSQTVNIKIKQEIEDPLDTPSSSAQGDLSCQGLEKMHCVPSLFQPPVLIKEEIVSEEEL